MDVYEALYTTRAMRRVEPSPIPLDAVQRMLDAAIRAPSASNSQNWRFVTVTDRSTMKELAKLYADAFRILTETVYAGAESAAAARGDHQMLRVTKSSRWLAENFAEVPLVVFAFHRNDPSGSSIYPAVWSMMLAARAEGIGTTLTTVLGFFKHEETFELLGVPSDKGWALAAAVTCGYPLGRWGVPARRPAQEVVYAETWGESPGWQVPNPMWSGYE